MFEGDERESRETLYGRGEKKGKMRKVLKTKNPIPMITLLNKHNAK